jgi:excisionase family DNA binding protein
MTMTDNLRRRGRPGLPADYVAPSRGAPDEITELTGEVCERKVEGGPRYPKMQRKGVAHQNRTPPACGPRRGKKSSKPGSPASRASRNRDPRDPERRLIAGPAFTDTTRVDGLRRRHHRDDQIKFFTIAELAERLSVSTRTVRRWIEAGDLVVHRLGSVVRIAEDDLRTFLAVHRDR